MPIGEQLFLQVALDDHHAGWELLTGELRRKPGATSGCSHVVHDLMWMVTRDLHRAEWGCRVNVGYLKVADDTYYRPDGFVMPASMVGYGLDPHQDLEHYAIPVPLALEVWPRYTREYGFEHRGEPMRRIRDYQRRGDAEIWLAHSYRPRLTIWRRSDAGSYTRTIVRGGTVHPVFMPSATVDLDELYRPLPQEAV